MNIEYVKIETIHEDPLNTKIHTDPQIEHIKNSIKEVGFADPISVWGDTIIDGNGRYRAAVELGLEQVPIIRLDHLTEVEQIEYGIVHNQLTMNTGFVDDQLAEQLRGIHDIDMTAFGFNEMDFGTMFDEGKETVPKKVTVNIYPAGRDEWLGSLLTENGYKYRIK